MNTNGVVAGSLAVILGLAGLASGQARAESLTVESGQTVSVAAAATYDSVTVRGALEISDATLTTAARVSLDGGTIRLGDGGVLSAAGIDVGASDSILSFEGGRCLLTGQIKTGGAGKLSIVGAGGDVLLDYNCSSWGYCFRQETSAGKITVSGDCNCVINVKKEQICLANSTSALTMSHTGRTEVWGKLLIYYDDFPNGGELCLGKGAVLDIGGVWVTLRALTGLGTLKGTAGCQLTLSVPENGAANCVAAVGNTVKLIKAGAGVLNVMGTMPKDFTVEAGEIRVLSRSEVGYSQFRLKVDGVKKNGLTGMQLNELAFFSGDEDVTAGYDATSFDTTAGYSGGSIFDKKDTTKWWYNYDNQSNPSFDKAWVEVSYPERRIVTGYKIKSQDWGGETPNSWRLYGRDAGGEWELIAQKVSETTVPDPTYNWSPQYPIDGPVHPGVLACQGLTLAKGTVLTVPANTKFSCTGLTDNGATFDFAAGSEVDRTNDEDCESRTLYVGNGIFVKSGNGVLSSVGSANGAPEQLKVMGGTLAFKTAFVPWKHWKFVFGDVYNLSGKELTMGEIAVYDFDGNRLNLSGSETLASLDESSFSAQQNPNLYDGNGSSQGWVDASNLNPSNESTWKYTTFTLAETAPAVAGYNLMTASYVANGRPKTWKVFARESADDDWTLIDSQVDVPTPGASMTWYHAGTPWQVLSDQVAGSAAFPSATPVSVAPGAVLDLTLASQTVLSDLIVDGDAVGFGTIRGGVCAGTGVIRVGFADVVPRGTIELPLKFEDVEGCDAVADWTVMINGVTSKKRLSVRADGRLCLIPPGSLVIVK